RLVGGDRGDVVDPVDRPVDQVLGEVVSLLRRAWRVDLPTAVVEDRREVVGLGAEEAVEGVEPLLGGPAVERSGGRRLPWRGLVHLPEGAGRVAVTAQHAGDGGCGIGPGPVVSRCSRGVFCDHPHAHAVVVTAGERRGAGRRAQCRGVEARVAAPSPVSRSAVGMRTGPPKAEDVPKPTSSSITSRMLGAPSGARTGRTPENASRWCFWSISAGTRRSEPRTGSVCLSTADSYSCIRPAPLPRS